SRTLVLRKSGFQAPTKHQPEEIPVSSVISMKRCRSSPIPQRWGLGEVDITSRYAGRIRTRAVPEKARRNQSYPD
ncbi:MAG: hypothetical protein QF536_09940, partial [Arenicellales bacterium]|nr:hypothetical protein [Arenicellales bacterium]